MDVTKKIRIVICIFFFLIMGFTEKITAEPFKSDISNWRKACINLKQSVRNVRSSYENNAAFERLAVLDPEGKYRRLGLPVGRLDIMVQDNWEKDLVHCTAWLVTDSYAVTNYHCIPGLGNERIVKAGLRLGYLSDNQQGHWYDVNPVPIESNKKLDYSILKVSGNPGRLYGTVTIEPRRLNSKEGLLVIHHPLASPAMLTRKDCRVADRSGEGADLRHLCDTLEGSSGAPLFSDESYSVVGIHFAGAPIQDRYSANLAKRLEMIAQESPILNRIVKNSQLASRRDSIQPHDKYYTDPTTTDMKFVWVEGGCFDMGQTQKEKEQLIREEGEDWYKDYATDELPNHRVCVDGFWMGQHEVTVGQFRKFIRETGYETDAERNAGGVDGCYAFKDSKWGWQSGYNWQQVGFSQENNYPVACVSWNDTQAFITWLNRKSGRKYRLPTEAEWEYAARGGTKTIRYWGDAVDSSACSYENVADQKYWTGGFSCDDFYQYAAPVGKFWKNNFDLYDMLGNVREWCQDWYGEDYYNSSPRSNPKGSSSDSYRVIRGGCWSSYPRSVRSALRGRGTPVDRYGALGFRLALPPGQ